MLEIESWEDRSGLPEPGPQSFGFVYFSDGSRVGFSDGDVWQPRTNGGGQRREVTRKHLAMAAKLLEEQGVF